MRSNSNFLSAFLCATLRTLRLCGEAFVFRRHTMSTRKIGEVILEVNNISLAFGGVKALTDKIGRASCRERV